MPTAKPSRSAPRIPATPNGRRADPDLGLSLEEVVEQEAAQAASSRTVEIKPPNLAIVALRIVGTAPLICNAFPDKTLTEWEHQRSREQKAGEQEKKVRPVRNYKQEFADSLYPLSSGKGYGIPAIWFKRSMVGACRNVNLAMTEANRWIYVLGDDFSKGYQVIRIEGKPEMRRDMVRLSNRERTPDIRFRGEFKEWACNIRIKFNADALTPAGLINLLNWAGETEGVGEMRPSAPKKSFDFGLFRVEMPEGDS